MGFDKQHLLPRTATVGDELMQMFGLRTIGGWRKSDPYPDHPGGYALDLMTNDIGGPKLRNPKGDAIANYLIANADRIGVDYIIWNGQSWNSRRRTWAKYSGSNPHTDHVHLTLLKSAAANGAYTPMSLGDVGSLGTGVASKLFDIDGFMQKAQGTSMTLGAAMFGIVLIGTGLVLAVRPAITKKLGG